MSPPGPPVFLLDKQGRIRWMHVGEGHYDEAERLIQKLLAEEETQSEGRRNGLKSEKVRGLNVMTGLSREQR